MIEESLNGYCIAARQRRTEAEKYFSMSNCIFLIPRKNTPCDANLAKSARYINTALIKQISQFDTAFNSK